MDGNESDNSDNSHNEYRDDESDGSEVEVVDIEHGEDEASSDDSGADDDSVEAEPYDISISATHSYLGEALELLRGRGLLAGGWSGRVPALVHHAVLFPGESVPMLLPRAADAAQLAAALQRDRLFALLFPDDSGAKLSGYGVVCEVLMADFDGRSAEAPSSVTFKARAAQRVRLAGGGGAASYSGMRPADVRALPGAAPRPPLAAPRLASLDALRRPAPAPASASAPASAPGVQRWLRTMDAAVTPWPLFLYDMFDYERMRRVIRDYFKTVMLEDKLPVDAESLSYWTASNLTLSRRDRLALFVVDNALLRMYMECDFINMKSALCCTACETEIARREHILAMSSEGVHSNYTNLGGYMHDVLTVSRAHNVVAGGAASAQFSWFPGYAWSVASCASCRAHVGWRFEAQNRSLRPQKFYGLCRNYVQPRASDSDSHDVNLEPQAAHPGQHAADLEPSVNDLEPSVGDLERSVDELEPSVVDLEPNIDDH